MLRLHQDPGEGEERLPPLAPAEAMLFSDIRLHMALVLRPRNPHLFRPDLFERHIEPTAEILEELAAAQGMAKLRYLSEEPLADDRHLTFMPRLADAIASMSASRVVFDSVAEKLQTAREMHSQLCSSERLDVPDLHLRVVWMPREMGGCAATRGLAKVGLPELETPTTRPDHQAIVCEVLRLAAETLWTERSIAEPLHVECYDDTFEVRIEPARTGPLLTHIMRISES
jgi:hypothetical protein